MRRHLVTGGAGLIGFEVARQLLEDGDEVVIVDDFRRSGREELGDLAMAQDLLDVVEANLAEPGWEEFARGPFDTVFHLAAVVGVSIVEAQPYETLRNNTLSTVRVLDHALGAGCRALAFASSSENYASGVSHGWVDLPTAEDVPLVIDDIALPRWSYAASKIAGESAVFGAARVGSFTPLILRFHNVYGPRMSSTYVIPAFLDRCANKVDPFPVYGTNQTRSFLFVSDAARAVRLVAETGNAGLFNIGSDAEIRIAELAERVFAATDHHPAAEPRPAPFGSVARRVPDISKLQALGFEAEVDLDEGIARCWKVLPR